MYHIFMYTVVMCAETDIADLTVRSEREYQI